MPATQTLPWHCDKCNSPLIPTTSGSVCSEGCGKLHGKLPSKVASLNIARVSLGLTQCRQNRDRYTIDGMEGTWEKTKNKRAITRLLYERPDDLADNEVLAIDGDKIIRLVPHGSQGGKSHE